MTLHISDTCAGLQKQIDGLHNFCSKNSMAVNEIKTKCITFGKTETINVIFNNKNIAQVAKYKFLGNIIMDDVFPPDDLCSRPEALC